MFCCRGSSVALDVPLLCEPLGLSMGTADISGGLADRLAAYTHARLAHACQRCKGTKQGLAGLSEKLSKAVPRFGAL